MDERCRLQELILPIMDSALLEMYCRLPSCRSAGCFQCLPTGRSGPDQLTCYQTWPYTAKQHHAPAYCHVDDWLENSLLCVVHAERYTNNHELTVLTSWLCLYVCVELSEWPMQLKMELITHLTIPTSPSLCLMATMFMTRF